MRPANEIPHSERATNLLRADTGCPAYEKIELNHMIGSNGPATIFSLVTSREQEKNGTTPPNLNSSQRRNPTQKGICFQKRHLLGVLYTSKTRGASMDRFFQTNIIDNSITCEYATEETLASKTRKNGGNSGSKHQPNRQNLPIG